MSNEVAQEQVAGTGIAGNLLRDPPAVVVTAPTGPQSASTVTVTWTYFSTLSKPQYTYRVQLLNQHGTAVLYDSSNVESTDLTFACPFALSASSSYIARVTVSDGTETSSDDSAFTADFAALAVFPTVDTVGNVYEVAINGVGYMLADTEQLPYKRSSGTLQAPRFATSDTPFSEAVERYSFVGASDWSYGAGQAAAEREASDPRAYLTSQSVDPFTNPGELRLLPTTYLEAASALAVQKAVVASDALLVMAATDGLKRMTTVEGTETVMTFTGDTLTDLETDGINWYAVNTDEEIFKGASTTIGAAWANLSAQTSAIDTIAWCTDRIAVSYVNGSGQACLSTLSPAGAEEVAAGRWKHADAKIPAICAGDGFLWYAVNRGARSDIYAWSLGSADASFVAASLPLGEAVTGMFFYLGNVMVRATTGTEVIIYRAVNAAGELTLDRVLDFSSTTASGTFAGSGRFVLFSWEAMSDDGRSGVGCIDLATGGYSRWLQAPVVGATGAVQSIVVWKGHAGFTVGSYGVVLDDATALEATGYLQSSELNMASSLVKVLDEAALITEPLPTGGTVVVQVSTDGGDSFVAAGTLAGTGSTTGSWALAYETPSTAVRLTLTSAGAAFGPVVSTVQLKLHALSIVDQVLELPVNCLPRLVGLNGAPIDDGAPYGVARARALEALIGTRVSLQDVDYPVTLTVETWEVVGTEYTATGTYDRLKARRVEQAAQCLVTLRRAQ